MNGITGATLTPTGMPASASVRIAQPSRRRGCARLQLACQLGVERGDGHRRHGQVLRRHRRQQVDVAFDQGRLGDQTDRMIAIVQHLQHVARDAQFAFDRLIGIGIAPQRDRLAAIAGPGQRLAQQIGSVGLGEQPGLEVQPRRQLQVRMRRARKAVNAAKRYVESFCSQATTTPTTSGHSTPPRHC